MMFLDVEHKGIKTSAQNFITQNQHAFLVVSDYNNVVQKLERLENNQLRLSFKCFGFKNIFDVAGEYMLKKYYSGKKFFQQSNLNLDYIVAQPADAGFDITIVFDCSVIQKPQKIKGEATQEDLDNQKQLKLKNQEIVDRVSSQVASFKRNFYAACFEQTFDNVLKGQAQEPFKISTRENEFVCIIPKNDTVNIFVGVSFEDNIDKIFAKFVITEMIEAKRHVKNAPQFSFTPSNELQPKILTETFPDITSYNKKLQNGIINITLFKQQHISNNYANQATLLAGYRQYLHYHIHASKTYLHTRIIRRINLFYKSLKLGQFEKEEEVYRTNKEENQVIRQEEEKKSGIWKSG